MKRGSLYKNLLIKIGVFASLPILIFQQFSTMVFADATCTQQVILKSGDHYFNCAATCSSSSATSGSAGSYTPVGPNTYSAGDEYSFLIGKRLSPITAAAITGNAIWESGGSLTALTIRTDNPSTSVPPANGIHQWYDTRLTALQNFAQKQGKPWRDLGVQLDYLWLEFTNGQGAGADESGALAAVKAKTDIASATTTFEAIFEVSGATSSYPFRIAAAQAVLAKFGGGAGSSTTSTATDSSCSTSNNGPSSGSCSGGGKYSALVSSGSNFAGVDQGIDFTPSSSGFDICAPASGTIVQADQTGHQFNRTTGQTLVVEKLDQAPNTSNSSQYIYYIEIIQINSGITVNAHINKGALIGHNNANPGIEVGWASGSGGPQSGMQPLCAIGYPTSCGTSFDNWVQQQ